MRKRKKVASSASPGTSASPRSPSGPASPRKKTTNPGQDGPTPEAGISRLQWMAPDEVEELTENPLNYRRHPHRQRQTYRSFKSMVGWTGALLFNERTQRLIDGHMRRDEVVKSPNRGSDKVPVLVGSWTEEQERIILQSLDLIGTMAQTDEQALASLAEKNQTSLSKFSTQEAKTLRAFAGEVGNYAKSVAEGSSARSLYPTPSRSSRKSLKKEDPEAFASESDESVYTVPELKDDVFFKGDNKWGIPVLLGDLIATPDDLPRITYDGRPETIQSDAYYCHGTRPPPEGRDGGCLGFFTEDWRFEHVYEYPSDFGELILSEDWTCLVTPDFSIYDDYPFPLRLWNLYRSRWCARYWQGLGIRVIPSVTRIEEGITLETLPNPCPTLAFQCRTLADAPFSTFNDLVAYCVDVLRPEGVIIYGGVEHERKLVLPEGPRYNLLESFIGARKRQGKMSRSMKSQPKLGERRPTRRRKKVKDG